MLEGYDYIIIAVEEATKWIEAGCLGEKTTLAVKAWVTKISFAASAAPKEIVTDRIR